MNKRVVVTGGGGFIGAYLVKRLVHDGWRVGVVDTMIRGDSHRLLEVRDVIELFDCDVRDENALEQAFSGADVIMHLAAINGTENFYSRPELVLDVGLRGILAVVNAGRKAGVPDLVVASSAEVYQTPPEVPTSEKVPLSLPDSLNPRYSYGGSKIVSELVAFNYAKEHYRKVQVFRPHNVYGPDMGWKHVIPQLTSRAMSMPRRSPGAKIPFEIQGDGSETRAFCYVDDIVDGILSMYQNGGNPQIYHIGNDTEITIRELVDDIGRVLNLELDLITTAAPLGGTPRRCPDITKMRQLGYEPKIVLAEGLRRTAAWYATNNRNPAANDML